MPKYYNAMLIGHDRNIQNCAEVHDRLQGYHISVVSSCGVGMDGTCNKRISYTGNGGIGDVRQAFDAVIDGLELELEYVVNSNRACVF